MIERDAVERWRPTRVQQVAGVMVIAGFLLTGVSWWFMLLVAAGTLGPGLLREVGWLRDKDEFQRRADHRAGYHAFLAVGLLAFVLLAYFRSAERAIEHTDELTTLFLVLLWFTWLLSSLVSYWGPRRAAAWILRIFGSVVLAFTIVSNVGSEWTGWPALLMQPLLALPFFLFAGLSTRWPRTSGTVLLALSLFLLYYGFSNDNLPRITQGVTAILLVGPLLAAGTALLRVPPHKDTQ